MLYENVLEIHVEHVRLQLDAWCVHPCLSNAAIFLLPRSEGFEQTSAERFQEPPSLGEGSLLASENCWNQGASHAKSRLPPSPTSLFFSAAANSANFFSMSLQPRHEPHDWAQGTIVFFLPITHQLQASITSTHTFYAGSLTACRPATQ